MPTFDLQRDSATFNDSATASVLAVMCAPEDHNLREAMVARATNDIGRGPGRRRPLTESQFLGHLAHSMGRGIVAGRLLLNLLQLSDDGVRPSLNLAIKLLLPMLPEWQQPMPHIWSQDQLMVQFPRSKANMLAAYKDYRPVAHLWAAFFHAYAWGDEDQWMQADLWPGLRETLPGFLACSDFFLGKGSDLPLRASSHRFALSRREAWSFIVPPPLRQVRTLIPMPLTDEQKAIVNEGRRTNRLSS